MVLALTTGFFAVDAQANTSAEEVLRDSPADVILNTSVQEEEATVSEEATEPESSDETEATTATEPTPVDDYGDEVLNQLYAE